MKILFTGGSSFTGYWFIKELADAGHDVVATFTRQYDDYDGIRLQRISKLLEKCTVVWNCSFGSDIFLDIIKSEIDWDVLCIHGANANNYKSQNFDIVSALNDNTYNAKRVLDALQKRGLSKVIYTGSVFESNEGLGEEPLRAFSPYGLSKGFTSEIFEYLSKVRGINYGKFVIPNPFGPYEEERFTAYLVKSWFNGVTPTVQTPEYIRDNIHVSLLACSYLKFLTINNPKNVISQKVNPSGYVESQGVFAERFAKEMGSRIGVEARVILKEQVDFSEPLIRINDHKAILDTSDWSEESAWDEMAKFYLERNVK
jgi:UDP-glucose 4-epimerase